MSKASVYFSLGVGHQKSEIGHIRRALQQIPGVNSVSFSRNDGRLAVDYDNHGADVDRIESKMKEMGYTAKAEQQVTHTM